MLQLVSIDLDSFLGRNLDVHADYILSNQDVTFSMNVKGSMDIEILEGTLYAILSCSWWLIQVYSLLLTIPFH